MTIATVNPATGELIEEFIAHGPDVIDARLAAATEAQRELARASFAERAVWMKRAADILDDDQEMLARLLTQEMGKTVASARAEVAKCASSLRFYADHAEGYLAPTTLDDPQAAGAVRAGTVYRPLGVVLAVMPWNYPLWQVIRFAAPALMAGNAGLLKHASNVPQSALYLDTLFGRAGFPEGAFRTLLIPSGAVEALLADPRIAAVTLTGSEPAGRAVAATAAAHIKKSVLELGGSDPFIVMPSADLDRAVAVAVTARTQNNGQSCIAGKRFIVHESIHDEFLERFTRAMSALVLGDPAEETTDLGPLATASGREELAALVDDARARGAVVHTGGSTPPGAGWFYPATVLSGITPEMRLATEEAFGPVATVWSATDVDDAIRLANATDFGLSSAVWTEDEDERARFIDEIEAGAVFINGMTASHPALPFGGIKNSGFGRELAAEGIREFCNLKTVWVGASPA
ncbi:NADP-dependent succinic semialdehyde dehydrogenase [Microbacterium sp. MYb62]|uniref:NADP-dependent succinic semialdehyde dehydrogenase n=1 Tax=Microbacterium sp. MYb62 TaxID=1848690 RepID=UPI000CFDBFDC|nr:NADP-dependent succinic semialdehyde dehydrogenase [Microbacterium sp. MYb62]PRB18607.1 NADP-dependent succinic semialdehyde dehydrogenase [Microbacterium sp. MYb62]